MPEAASHERYIVGDLLLDVEQGAVSRRGELLPLPPRTFELLLALVRRAPGRVRRHELLDTVWPDEIVTDQTLSHRVLLLRKALGDDSTHPRFLASDRGWGYHLVAPVARLEQPRDGEALGRSRRWHLRLSIAVASTLALALGLAVRSRPTAPRGGGDAHASGPILLVVDDIATVSGDEALAFVGHHLCARLAATLGSDSSLEVRRGPARGGTVPRAHLGGAIERTGAGASLTLRLQEPGSQRLLWTKTETASVQELLDGEQRLAEEVVLAVHSALALQTPERSALAVAAQVGELCLRGEWLLRSWRGPELWRAVRVYEAALANDPASAEAHAGLSLSYTTLALRAELSARDAAPMARAHARLSVEHGPELAEPQAALGLVRLVFDWDLPGARQELRGAVAREPEAVVPLVAYAFCLQASEPDASLPLLRRAEALDPYAAPIPFLIGRAHYLARRPEAALPALERARVLDPHLAAAHWAEAQCHSELGNAREALAALLRERRLAGASPALLSSLERGSQLRGVTGLWARLCRDDEARQADPVRRAAACARAGEHGQALDWLRRGEQEHAPGLLAVALDPAFSSLWDDPALDRLLARTGLPTARVVRSRQAGSAPH